MIDLIKSLPDDVSVEDVMYHLYIKDTVLRRMKEIDDGNVDPISEQEAQERIKKWLM